LLATALMACAAPGQTFDERVQAAAGPVWFAYTVPAAPGQQQMCNWNEQRKLMLEGARELTVLYRVEKGTVQKIRVATEACEIDSGGLPVERINVTPAESIAILSRFAGQDSALHAIASHADPTAVTVLVRIAREDANPRIRGKALFWLANSAQRAIAKEEISRSLDQDPETEVKRSAVFALSRLPAGEGVPKLMEVAQSNRNTEVRRQAMFWLGQSKDPRAIAFFEKILTH
jgi:hypothetical protein